MRVVIAASLAAAVFLAGCKEEVALNSCTKLAAYEAAKTEVARRLQSPGSAKFPEASAPKGGVMLAGFDGCQFGVSAWVDSQNGFGALVRTRFSGKLTYTPATERWAIDQLHLAAH